MSVRSNNAEDDTNSKTNIQMNTTTVSANNNVGSAILALSAMLGSTFRRKPSAKAVRCQIALEKTGVIRPIEDRVKTNKALSATAYKHFSKLAKGGDEGAAKVLGLATELTNRNMAIVLHKADLTLPVAG